MRLLERKSVHQDDVEAVAKIARFHPKPSSNDRNKSQTLEEDLRRLIFGQDEAVAQVCTSIKLARAGIGHVDKPMGNFLFATLPVLERPSWRGTGSRHGRRIYSL